jgi:hypothetical protein
MTVGQLGLVALASVASCSGGEVGPFPPGSSTILMPGQAAHLTRPCDHPTSPGLVGTWLPSQTDIRDLEHQLDNLIEHALGYRIPPAQIPIPADYYRQYVGVTIEGRRVIYVSGFHKTFFQLEPHLAADSSFWRSHAMPLCYVWIHHFRAEFDPNERRFRNMAFDGVL